LVKMGHAAHHWRVYRSGTDLQIFYLLKPPQIAR
jgi:hypothetical protein